jgi:hypothetical protein
MLTQVIWLSLRTRCTLQLSLKNLEEKAGGRMAPIQPCESYSFGDINPVTGSSNPSGFTELTKSGQLTISKQSSMD